MLCYCVLRLGLSQTVTTSGNSFAIFITGMQLLGEWPAISAEIVHKTEHPDIDMRGQVSTLQISLN